MVCGCSIKKTDSDRFIKDYESLNGKSSSYGEYRELDLDDNSVIESKNGWIKKEMYIDFDINNYNIV